MAPDLPDNPVSLLELMASGDHGAFGLSYDRYARLPSRLPSDSSAPDRTRRIWYGRSSAGVASGAEL